MFVISEKYEMKEGDKLNSAELKKGCAKGKTTRFCKKQKARKSGISLQGVGGKDVTEKHKKLDGKERNIAKIAKPD